MLSTDGEEEETGEWEGEEEVEPIVPGVCFPWEGSYCDHKYNEVCVMKLD